MGWERTMPSNSRCLLQLHAKLVDAQDYPKLTAKAYPYLVPLLEFSVGT